MNIRPLLRRLGKPSHARRHVVQSVAASSMLTMVAVATAAVTLANQEPQPSTAAEAVTSTPAATPPSSAFVGPVAADDEDGLDVGVSRVLNVSADVADIPSPATAAYQRAESVMAKADESCQLRWTLVAAVGQVVSDHGRRGNRTITDEGVVRPALVGPVVRNQAGRPLSDTDAGKYDGDKRHDRAVGPMQLAPTTWTSVGVDGDGDGRRDPQDLDDAALAVAVLICADDHDLRNTDELREAVERVNDDETFVEAVLAVYAKYNQQLEADRPPTVVVPDVTPPDLPDVRPTPDDNDGEADDKPSGQPTGKPDPTDDASEEPSDPVTFAPVGNGPKGGPKPTDRPPTATARPTDPTTTPTEEPTEEPTECPTEPVEGSDDGPTAEPTDEPADDPAEDPCAEESATVEQDAETTDDTDGSGD